MATHILNKQFSVYSVGVDQEFVSIQLAIDKAYDAGGGTVCVYPGHHVEDLTLRPGVTIEGRGIADLEFVKIEGRHRLPNHGSIGFNHILFVHSHSTFYSDSSGHPDILFRSCVFDVGDGYTLDIPSLRGSVIFFDCLSRGEKNGFINNASGQCVPTIFDITIDSRNPAEMYLNSDAIFYNVRTRIKTTIKGMGSTVNYSCSCWNEDTISIEETTTVKISNSRIETGNNPALYLSEKARLSVHNTSIDSCADLVIAGTGVMQIGNVSFVTKSDISDHVEITHSEQVFMTTQSAGREGEADPLPSAPAGYLTQKINGEEYLIPFFNKLSS